MATLLERPAAAGGDECGRSAAAANKGGLHKLCASTLGIGDGS